MLHWHVAIVWPGLIQHEWNMNLRRIKKNKQTTDFCHRLSAEDFTLEKIIELGLDQFAEQISEVSGAASKELSIEQVGS